MKVLGGTEVPEYRWRQEDGGMSVSPAKGREELAKEKERLRKVVSDPTWDTMLLPEVAQGTF